METALVEQGRYIMSERNYYQYCNLFFIENVCLSLFMIGLSCIIVGMHSVWPICWGISFGIMIIYSILKKRISELSEQEKELRQSFTSLHMLIYSLPFLAVGFQFFIMIFYSYSDLQDVRDIWANVVQSIWGGLMVVHIVGAYFVTWLEKQFYKYFIKPTLE